MLRVSYPCTFIFSFLSRISSWLKISVVVVLSLSLPACSWTGFSSWKIGGPKLSKRVVNYGEPVPKGGGVYKIGSPYKIQGVWYHPKEQRDYDEVGIASWYGHMFHGRYTANGEVFDMDALTAAHPTLPIPSYVKVTNRKNGRSLILRVNDRGPYANDRIIDLSRYAARLLGFEKAGTTPVRVTYIRPAPLNGDDRMEKRYLADQSWMRPRNRRYSRYNHRGGYNRVTTSSLKRRSKKRVSRRRIRGRFVVQAGVYQSIWNAERMQKKIRKFGRTYIRKQYRGSFPVYRLMVGPYRNRYKAGKVADKVASVGIYDAIVINSRK